MTFLDEVFLSNRSLKLLYGRNGRLTPWLVLTIRAYYNAARPHQGIEQQMPIPYPISVSKGEVHSHPILGGIIHDSYRAL